MLCLKLTIRFAEGSLLLICGSSVYGRFASRIESLILSATFTASGPGPAGPWSFAGGYGSPEGHRSLPPPVADSGRRSVGNRKEHLKDATMRVPRIGSPTYPY